MPVFWRRWNYSRQICRQVSETVGSYRTETGPERDSRNRLGSFGLQARHPGRHGHGGTMIGNKQIPIRSLTSYFYSGGDCTDEDAEFQPPAGGCYIRCDAGAGGDGSVTIEGTYGGEDVDETLTSFDSEGVTIGTQRFDTITAISVTLAEGTDSVTVYPASETGDIINYTTYSESYGSTPPAPQQTRLW